MQRLTKVNKQNSYVSIDGVGYNECLQRLAELEDKLENGQLLELPMRSMKDVIFYDKGMIDYGMNPIVVERYVYEQDAERRLEELKGEKT